MPKGDGEKRSGGNGDQSGPVYPDVATGPFQGPHEKGGDRTGEDGGSSKSGK